MEVQLISFDAEGQREVFAVPEGTTVVGRHLDCNYQVGSPNVSRRHFRLTLGTDGLFVKDLGSSNGTFINERRILESALKAGDKVRAADVTFRVTIDGQPAEAFHEMPMEKRPAEPVAVTESTGMADRVEQVRDMGLQTQLTEPSDDAINDPLSALAAMSRERQQ